MAGGKAQRLGSPPRSPAPAPWMLTVHGPLERPAVGPKQVLHRLQHRLQLLLLPYFRLGHLGHIQLAVCQFFCNEKDKGKSRASGKAGGTRGHQGGGPAAVRPPHPHPHQVITNRGDGQDVVPRNSGLSSPPLLRKSLSLQDEGGRRVQG